MRIGREGWFEYWESTSKQIRTRARDYELGQAIDKTKAVRYDCKSCGHHKGIIRGDGETYCSKCKVKQK